MASILIVDDDERVADSVAIVLNASGHETRIETSARSGEAAMRQSPDACVLDVWLGADDGLSLAETASGAGLPIVVISGGGPGRSLEAVTAKADAIGAVAVLFKPFEDEELIAAIDEALSTRRP